MPTRIRDPAPKILWFLGVGDLHPLHLLPSLIGTVHLKDFCGGAAPARGHPRLDRCFLHRIVPGAGEPAGTLIVTGALAHHDARAHAVNPRPPVLAGDVVVAPHAMTRERHAHHRALEVLDQNTPVERYLSDGSGRLLRCRGARLL